MVHAFTALSTHYHLLGAAPNGNIHHPLGRIQNAFTRRVNRKQARKGPGWEYRFDSRVIDSFRYWLNAMRYIDFNPVKAGLCDNPALYPHGTAIRYTSGKLPCWLVRAHELGLGPPDYWDSIPIGSEYAEIFGKPLTDDAFELVERQLKAPSVLEDNLDKLYSRPRDYVLRWMRKKIAAAKGVSPWTPIATQRAVVAAVNLRAPDDAQDTLVAGLLATVACATSRAIGKIVNCHRATASRRVVIHKERVMADPLYGALAAEVIKTALHLTHD